MSEMSITDEWVLSLSCGSLKAVSVHVCVWIGRCTVDTVNHFLQAPLKNTLKTKYSHKQLPLLNRNSTKMFLKLKLQLFASECL